MLFYPSAWEHAHALAHTGTHWGAQIHARTHTHSEIRTHTHTQIKKLENVPFGPVTKEPAIHREVPGSKPISAAGGYRGRKVNNSVLLATETLRVNKNQKS